MRELIKKVEKWAEEKGIDKPEYSPQQLNKIVEELGEVAGAYLKGDTDGLAMEVGDYFVTMIIFCHQQGLTPEDCLFMAYKKIKGRSGKTENGVFVKDE